MKKRSLSILAGLLLVKRFIWSIFKDGELTEDSVIRNFRTTAADGKSYNNYK